MIVVEDPDVRLLDPRVIKDLTGDTAPGETVTVGKELVTPVAPIFARRVVAVPETKPVKVAV